MTRQQILFYPSSARLLLALLSILIVGSGCSPLQSTSAIAPVKEDCLNYFHDLNHKLTSREVLDQGSALIKGFPYLRADRFLASFSKQPMNEEQTHNWLQMLADNDRRSRKAELLNLGKADRDFNETTLNRCREQLIAKDLQNPTRINVLKQNIKVPDDYRTDWRVLGLYPITRLFIRAGFNKWQRQVKRVFATPIAALSIKSKLVRWSSKKTSQQAGYSFDSNIEISRNSLDIPQPEPQTLEKLFDQNAPVWEVDVNSDNDLIGSPSREGLAGVDTRNPVEYRLVSYTRWQGKILLQLNYVIWFERRPGKDIYAGNLDGLIWRVTLASDGLPIMYDSIHNCGCYHYFFPAQGMVLRPETDKLPEPPLVPQAAPQKRPIIIRLSTGTHYIQRLYSDHRELSFRQLQSKNYDNLRGSDGNGSLFSRHGLVPGTERKERFLLWPSGIRSPGAMRQWGRHATAFVGRRHFDDPFLLEEIFQ